MLFLLESGIHISELMCLLDVFARESHFLGFFSVDVVMFPLFTSHLLACNRVNADF